MDPSGLLTIAKHVMKLLVERRFDELEEASGGVTMDATELEDAVDEAGATLVMPPEPEWHKLQVQAIRNWPGAFNVGMDLWTSRGRSDLRIDLTLHTKNGKPVIEVEGILVR